MKTPLIMSGEVLEELVFSLQTSFSRVKADELASPSAKNNFLKIQRWIKQVESKSSQQADDSALSQVPALPITGAELNALQKAVDVAVQRREARQLPLTAEQAESLHKSTVETPPQSMRERLHTAVNHVHASSVILAVVLALSLLFNVVELVALQSVPLMVLASINIGALIVALIVWAVLHWHLLQHIHLMHFHL